jgi:hypothetical protein
VSALYLVLNSKAQKRAMMPAPVADRS